MRALITASFDDAAKARLARHMDVVHEDWKARRSLYFDGAEFARRIREVGADVLIVEADLVHAEVLEAVPLKMIGCCRGDPVNIDLALLTDREREVLQLIAEGKTNKEIAIVLSVSINTVETHRKHIMEKLDLHNTAEIVRFAVRKKIVH